MMASPRPAHLASALVASLLLVGCGKPGDVPRDEHGVPLTCGDGRLDRGEACDDGNREPLDGCHSDCQLPGTVSWSRGATYYPSASDWGYFEEYYELVSDVAVDDGGNLYLSMRSSRSYGVDVGFIDEEHVETTIERLDAENSPVWMRKLGNEVVTYRDGFPQSGLTSATLRWSSASGALALVWFRSLGDPSPWTLIVAGLNPAGQSLWETQHDDLALADMAFGPGGGVALTGERLEDDPLWPEPVLWVYDTDDATELLELERGVDSPGNAGRALAYGVDGALYAALSHTREAAWILRLRPDGSVDLEGEVPCPGWSHLRGLPDGNLLLAGVPIDDTAVHLCVIDPDLEPVRSTLYQAPGPTYNRLNAMAIGPTGRVALTGSSADETVPDGRAYSFLAYLEPDLTVRWEWSHSSAPDLSEYGTDVEIAPAGDVYLLRRYGINEWWRTVWKWDVDRFRP